jgi:hypothetical protein
MNVLAHTLLEVYGPNGEEECYNFLRGIVEHILPSVFLRDVFGRDTQLGETAAVFVSLLRQLGPSPAAAADAMESIAGFPLELLTFKWMPSLFAAVSFTSAASQQHGSSGGGGSGGGGSGGESPRSSGRAPGSPSGVHPTGSAGVAASQQHIGLPLPTLHACWDVSFLLGFPGVLVTAIALWKLCEEDVVAVLRRGGHALPRARGGADAGGVSKRARDDDEDDDDEDDDDEDEEEGDGDADIFWWPMSTVFGDVDEAEEDEQEYVGAGLSTYALPEDSEDDDEAKEEDANGRNAAKAARDARDAKSERARAQQRVRNASAPRSGEGTLVLVQRAMDARLQTLSAPALLEAVHQVLLRCERLPMFRAMRWQHQRKVWASAIRSGKGEVWGTRLMHRMENERRHRQEERRVEEQRRQEAEEEERRLEAKHQQIELERESTAAAENVRYLEEQGRVFAARQQKQREEKDAAAAEKAEKGGENWKGSGGKGDDSGGFDLLGGGGSRSIRSRSRAGSEAEAYYERGEGGGAGDEEEQQLWAEQQREKEDRLRNKRRSTSPADPSSSGTSAASGLTSGLLSGGSGSTVGSSLLSGLGAGLSGIVSDVRGSVSNELKGLQQELKELSVVATSGAGAGARAGAGGGGTSISGKEHEYCCLCVNKPLPLRKSADPESKLTGQVLEAGWAFVAVRKVVANSEEAMIEHAREAMIEHAREREMTRDGKAAEGPGPGGKIATTRCGDGDDGGDEGKSETDGESTGEGAGEGTKSATAGAEQEQQQEQQEQQDREWAKVSITHTITLGDTIPLSPLLIEDPPPPPY